MHRLWSKEDRCTGGIQILQLYMLNSLISIYRDSSQLYQLNAGKIRSQKMTLLLFWIESSNFRTLSRKFYQILSSAKVASLSNFSLLTSVNLNFCEAIWFNLRIRELKSQKNPNLSQRLVSIVCLAITSTCLLVVHQQVLFRKCLRLSTKEKSKTNWVNWSKRSRVSQLTCVRKAS